MAFNRLLYRDRLVYTPGVTKTETIIRGTVIHEHGHPTRLRAAVRIGDTITYHRLDAVAPHYGDALTEAITMLPDVPFTCPRLNAAT